MNTFKDLLLEAKPKEPFADYKVREFKNTVNETLEKLKFEKRHAIKGQGQYMLELTIKGNSANMDYGDIYGIYILANIDYKTQTLNLTYRSYGNSRISVKETTFSIDNIAELKKSVASIKKDFKANVKAYRANSNKQFWTIHRDD